MNLARTLGALLLFASLPACDRDRPTPTVTRATAAAAPTLSATAAAPAPASAHPLPARPSTPRLPAAQVVAHQKALGALVAAFNAHDPKAIAALYDPGAVVVGPSPGGFTPEIGREPLVVGHEALFASQPDVKSATARLIMVGDHAVQEWVTRGTAAASGKPVGFRAASVYRFGSDGLIKRDSTYFDLLTPAVQTGKKSGEARPIPALPEALQLAFADETAQDLTAVRVLRSLHAALRAGKIDQVGPLLADDVVLVSHLRVQDTVGREAVLKELGEVVAQLPGVEITGAWGDESVGAAEVVFSAPARDGGAPQARLHALHVVDLVGGRIQKSALYASRRELEDE